MSTKTKSLTKSRKPRQKNRDRTSGHPGETPAETAVREAMSMPAFAKQIGESELLDRAAVAALLHRACEGSDARNELSYLCSVAVEHREDDTTEDEAPRVDAALDHADKSSDEQERLSLGGWPPKAFLANRRALALLLWLETTEFTGALRLNTGGCGASFDEHAFGGIEEVAELFIMPGSSRRQVLDALDHFRSQITSGWEKLIADATKKHEQLLRLEKGE